MVEHDATNGETSQVWEGQFNQLMVGKYQDWAVTISGPSFKGSQTFFEHNNEKGKMKQKDFKYFLLAACYSELMSERALTHSQDRMHPGEKDIRAEEIGLFACSASSVAPGKTTEARRCGKVKIMLFVPYAFHNKDAYAKRARQKFESLGYGLDSIHEAANPVEAIQKAEGIFIGGGNTFRLLKSLYDNNLVSELHRRVFQDGIPYIGSSSAGTNLGTANISTTNDMPIVFPPSFKAIGLIPFNINLHYLDADPNNEHMGETREKRIEQYHEEPDTPPVLGLREGSMLLVEGDKVTLLGSTRARLFIQCICSCSATHHVKSLNSKEIY
uniref:LOW QUALITY PROTEIN: alpha-aspartyl dipeptidase n=1 Tax=Pristiophorus japonicus TaxID=55135 RepID=UPI00398F37F2